MFGFLNINKPVGPTSHDIVAQVRRRTGRDVKVGHSGTLDPFAGGVLVVCLGHATRLADRVQAAPKRYRTAITLGATSTTDDLQGDLTPLPLAIAPAESAVRKATDQFVGQIDQVPPAHSAVHVDGQRAYALARKGQQVNLSSRMVSVYSIELLRYDYPLLELDVRCGAGTYIRSLARDIGKVLGVGGYCSALTRTAVGAFTIQQAVSLENLDLVRDLASPLTALADVQRVMVPDAAQLDRLRHGNGVLLESPAEVGEAALVGETGELLALGTVQAGGIQVRPTKVFVSEQTL